MILLHTAAMVRLAEQSLTRDVGLLRDRGISIHIAAILFREDVGSVLYTTKKAEAAARVGIGYTVHEFSLRDPIDHILKTVTELNQDTTITGIIIQKPWRQTWERESQSADQRSPRTFTSWWQQLVSSIAEKKDVDGLHPHTLHAIKRNTWQQQGRVLPATCQAVLTILDQALYQTGVSRQLSKIAIIGRSDLLGTPLYYQLLNLQCDHVKLFGKKELSELVELGYGLQDFDVVVSSTGQRHLITGSMIKPGAIVIDVGEPQPDVEYQSVKDIASFLTPVPGGVGPMTIVSLLRNAVTLASSRKK